METDRNGETAVGVVDMGGAVPPAAELLQPEPEPEPPLIIARTDTSNPLARAPHVGGGGSDDGSGVDNVLPPPKANAKAALAVLQDGENARADGLSPGFVPSLAAMPSPQVVVPSVDDDPDAELAL